MAILETLSGLRSWVKRNFTVIAGTGITVTGTPPTVAVDQSFSPTWTGVHTFSALPVFSAGINTGGAHDHTISGGGGITITTAGWIRIDTEGGAATDGLDTITFAGTGYIILVSSVSAARVPTLAESGNLILAGNFELSSPNDYIVLFKNSSSWVELSRSDNA